MPRIVHLKKEPSIKFNIAISNNKIPKIRFNIFTALCPESGYVNFPAFKSKLMREIIHTFTGKKKNKSPMQISNIDNNINPPILPLMIWLELMFQTLTVAFTFCRQPRDVIDSTILPR
ncbi:hypothetical protein [Paenibacillus sp. BC26]|uniref:hypothetical protein n=1 Tax=Paenibacillus sp. BC26 TaxID=1881032 RepID=UPI001160399B|nr:hypothetical protein [Paenibacillus sp. BC26]